MKKNARHESFMIRSRLYDKMQWLLSWIISERDFEERLPYFNQRLEELMECVDSEYYGQSTNESDIVIKKMK